MVSSPLVISADTLNRLNNFRNNENETFYNINIQQNVDCIKNSSSEMNNINFSQCSDTDSMTMICSDYSCNDDHCCDSNVTIYHPHLNFNNFQYCNEHHNLDNQTEYVLKIIFV